jgi:hypothetical protein
MEDLPPIRRRFRACLTLRIQMGYDDHIKSCFRGLFINEFQKENWRGTFYFAI